MVGFVERREEERRGEEERGGDREGLCRAYSICLYSTTKHTRGIKAQ